MPPKTPPHVNPLFHQSFFGSVLSKLAHLPVKGLAKETGMNKRSKPSVSQPKPVTPGVTRAMVRQHAYELYRDKLQREELTLEDWVLAEKDLVADLQEGSPVA